MAELLTPGSSNEELELMLVRGESELRAGNAERVLPLLEPIERRVTGIQRARLLRLRGRALARAQRSRQGLQDLDEAIRLFGHGAPVLVQTMTGTMPGWNHWNATHMITIFAFDFSHKNPALDTVTYVDTSSRLTGYAGRGVETISVKALWTAMHAFLVQAPYDPVNIIS